jgi:hypothetical protein
VEYEKFEQAKAAIAGMNGKQIYDQDIECDFAFLRGPSTK